MKMYLNIQIFPEQSLSHFIPNTAMHAKLSSTLTQLYTSSAFITNFVTVMENCVNLKLLL